jgi:ferredoxin
MWTPALDMRVGTSGCLPNCTACGQACPTGALKPLTLDEKAGKGDFAAQGPLSLGTAFVDHGRCLPWSMDKFCIVCQEVCPTSPKAITTRPRYATLRDGRVEVESLDGERVRIAGPLPEGVVQGVYLRPADQDDASAQRVIRIEGGDVVLEGALHPEDLKRSGGQVELQARLEVPFVDPNLCIGCGICEHECPIDGERAIRVTAEGESREPSHSIVL